MAWLRTRTELGFGLVCLVLLSAFLSLGIWQLERLAWKRELLHRIHARMTGAPVPLPEETANLQAFDYRRVKVHGRFIMRKTQLLGPRTHNGASGYHLLTPLRLDDGRILMVNRGWVPAGSAGNVRSGRLKPPDEPRHIEGVLRTDLHKGFWTPEHDADAGLWFWYDIAGLSRQTGLDLMPAVLEAAPLPDAPALPAAGVTRVDIPNDHLQYALTWFGLAAVVVAMYLAWLYRRRRTAGEGDGSGG
ncbi:MAG TPA: SURF1 family protein [Alphaproteobacteria bacterium]|nr:SURF1 family protein [Alphaproteobacteria bacterium]